MSSFFLISPFKVMHGDDVRHIYLSVQHRHQPFREATSDTQHCDSSQRRESLEVLLRQGLKGFESLVVHQDDTSGVPENCNTFFLCSAFI